MSNFTKLIRIALLAVLGVAVTIGTVLWARGWGKSSANADAGAHGPELPGIELVAAGGGSPSGAEQTIEVPEDIARTLGVKSIAARPAPPPEPLKLSGSLFLDSTRLARVHTRFAGEVVEIGKHVPAAAGAGSPTAPARPLRFGDKVQAGQLLAVVWSKDLGEKKSELVDAVGRYRLDKELMDRLEEAYRKNAVPERSVREAERNVEADIIAVQRAERTLRSWRLTEAEIEAIKKEADELRKPERRREREQDQSWARVEVRAPLAGTILEMNVAVGDVIDTTLDMFKIADLSVLKVLANAYEEDLPRLQRLKPEERRWSIRLKSDPDAPPLESTFDQIGDIIDPNQRTALVLGTVPNPDGRLRVGQFIIAQVPMPAPADEVAVPKTAVYDDGQESTIFVQDDPQQHRYTSRKVVVKRRCRDEVYLAARVTAAEKQKGFEAVQPNEKVVSSGAVELAAKLDDLQNEAKGKAAAQVAKGQAKPGDRRTVAD